jgi:hypothetical protein
MKNNLWLGSAIAIMLLGTAVGSSNADVSHAPNSAMTTHATKAIPAWGVVSLKWIALRAADDLGDSHPASVHFVKTTRNASANFMDGSADESYTVIMHGNFIDEKAFMPPGATAPTGRTLILIVRASDGAITDLVLNNLSDGGISQIGAVQDITND